MGNIVWAVIVAGAVAAGLWQSYVLGERAGRAECEASQAMIDRAAEASRRAMLDEAAKAIAGIKITHRTIRQEVEREIVEKPVFTDCRSGPELQRMYNDSAKADAPRTGSGANTGVVPAPPNP
jgi:protein tyrosine phosphatase (PTP) superfamily phosphohydrolase (DUF442 family)